MVQRYFLDCGFYIGNATKFYYETGMIDFSWKVYGFEASPKIKARTHAKKFPFEVKIIKKAVWTEDTTIPFSISRRHDASSAIVQTDRVVMRPAIDFSAFVRNLPEGADVICSMDIEGAEYPVLTKMIEEDTINRIKWLDIEFHHRLLPDKTEADSQQLIDELLRRGVGVRLKVPLN